MEAAWERFVGNQSTAEFMEDETADVIALLTARIEEEA